MGVRRSHIDCFPRPGGTGVSELRVVQGGKGKRLERGKTKMHGTTQNHREL